MKLFTHLALWLGFMSCTVGCHKVTYVSQKPPGQTVIGGNDFFLGGLIGKGKIEVKRHCPAGAAKILVYTGFVDGVLTGLTLGIYAPTSFKIVCAQTKSQGAGK